MREGDGEGKILFGSRTSEYSVTPSRHHPKPPWVGKDLDPSAKPKNDREGNPKYQYIQNLSFIIHSSLLQ